MPGSISNPEVLAARNSVNVELVMATVGRAESVVRFCEALESSAFRKVSMTVVDQAGDEGVARALERLDLTYPLRLVHAPLGLSRARNVGLNDLHGDVIGFPDDDCLYPKTLLRSVVHTLSSNPGLDGVTCSARDQSGEAVGARWAHRPATLTRSNIWRTAISYTIFLRREIVEAVGQFDESLGVGADTPWGSGEETDFLLRALEAGAVLRYRPDLHVVHPNKQRSPHVGAAYGRGMGRVLRKHRFPIAESVYHCVRPAVGALVSACRGDWRESSYRISVASGRATGYLAR